MDAQSFMETPELYLLGRCRSNDEQLVYVNTSTECLKEFKVRLHVGDIPTADIIKYYFSTNYDRNYIQADDITHCYQLLTTTLFCYQECYKWEILKRKLN